MSKGSWLFGFACGIAAGWLFAPEKGSDLRKKIFKALSQGKIGIDPMYYDEMELVQKLVTSAEQKSAVVKPRAIKAKRKVVSRKQKAKPKIQD